jgi:periplasmic protein TonB
MGCSCAFGGGGRDPCAHFLEWLVKRNAGVGPFFAIALVASVAGFGAGLVWPPPGGARATATERTEALHTLVPSGPTLVRATEDVPGEPRPRGSVGRADLQLAARPVAAMERPAAPRPSNVAVAPREAAPPVGSPRAGARREPPAGPREASATFPATEAAPPLPAGDRPPRRLAPADAAPLALVLDFDDGEEVRGSVQLRLEIGTDGTVHAAMVVSSEPVNLALERAAIAAARGWRYQPALRDGHPAEGHVLVTVSFEPRP